MIDRSSFLRRAGAGAAGVSLGGLLGPAAALASGGGDFPDHPRWRFVFVSHDTLDPLFVATQFGAQDAAALVRCTVQWTGSPRGSADETVRALRSAVSHKADGIAVSLPDVQALRRGARRCAPGKDPGRRLQPRCRQRAGPLRRPGSGCVRAARGEGARAAGRLGTGAALRAGDDADLAGREAGRSSGRPRRAARGSSGSRATCASWRPRSKTRSAPPGGPSRSTVRARSRSAMC